MLRRLVLVAGSFFMAVTPGLAAEDPPARIAAAMASLIPGLTPDRVRDAPFEGFYEVVFGPHVFYVSDDARFLLRGDVIDVETRENLTEAQRKKARVQTIDDLGKQNMIVFAPEQAEHTVTVFTDIDCGYCRKLHAEIDDYRERGIAVRYLAFPRAGIPSASYDKAVSVWCADDSHQAMTDAKAGKPVAPRQCENPVREHFQTGRLLGVRGTPTIILESGVMVPGYLPAQRLLEAIEEGEAG